MIPVEKVYVERALRKRSLVQEVLQNLGSLPPKYVDDVSLLIDELNTYEEDAVAQGKKILVVRGYKGTMVKNCPGTTGHICCGYKVINLMTNCPMDCSYCILQVYLNNPCLTLYPEFGTIFREIEDMIEKRPHHFFRFGTG